MNRSKGNWSTLDGVLQESWNMLARGATHFSDPFHWPVLGTAGSEGVSLRSVILRAFSIPDRVLVCYTDSRARKVQEISESSRVSWLFYHPKRRVQLRIWGTASLHTADSFADQHWAAASAVNRLNYCATAAPGTPIDQPSSGLPDLLLRKIPTLFDTEKNRANFTAIACHIDSLDWLVLQVTGNRRARFDWDEAGMTARWLIP